MPPVNAYRLSVLIVNYNSWPDTRRLVDELTSSGEVAAGAVEILVVDNASAELAPPELAASRPGVRLVEREDNGGFAVGVNAGWRLARAPWLLVLNPDVVTPPGFLSNVLERIRHYESLAEPPGIVGYALKNPDGSSQGSIGTFPSFPRVVYEQFIPRSRRKYQAGSGPGKQVVDWVTGACMLVSSGLLGQIGGMDEDFFLYHEEVALCRSANRAGWRVEFDPSVEVMHRDPLQNRALSPKMRLITRHSKLLYFRKHLPRWQFLAISWVVSAESGWNRLWSAPFGSAELRRSWAAIGEVSRSMRGGADLRGPAVRRMAEALSGRDKPTDEEARIPPDPAITRKPG